MRENTDLLRESQPSGSLREEAHQLFGSVIKEAPRLQDALQLILSRALDYLGSRRGLLYLYQPSEAQQFWNLAALWMVEPTEALLRIEGSISATDPTPDEEDFKIKFRSDTALPENFLFIPINRESLDGAEWIVAEVPEDEAELELRLPLLKDALRTLHTSIELIHSREILQLLESLSNHPDKDPELNAILTKTQKLLVQSIDAQEIVLHIDNEFIHDYYHCQWPGTEVTVTSKSLRAGDPVPLYPATTTIDRVADDIDGNFSSIIRAPLPGIKGTPIGIVWCKGRRTVLNGAISMAFDRYDAQKVEALAKMISLTIRRTSKRRATEVLTARFIHEIRNPIGSLRNIIHWLQRETARPNIDLTDKFRKRLNDAELDIETIRQLTYLMDSYRGQMPERPTSTRIFGDIILKAIPQIHQRLIRIGFARHQIQIETEDVNLIPHLFLVRSHAQQIVLNIADNALKYREGDRFRIKFRADHDNDFYKIRFSDWGVGVPRGWEDLIFEDGVRAPNVAQNSSEGMGVGLHIARDLAIRMGGNVTLTRHERPTEFTWDLPKGLLHDSIFR